MMNVLVFPIVASWVWSEGWLHNLGYRDFGGAGVVHIVGGTCGLVGSIFLGPRLGRFPDTLPLAENKIRDRIKKYHEQHTALVSQNEKRLTLLKSLVRQFDDSWDPDGGHLLNTRRDFR